MELKINDKFSRIFWRCDETTTTMTTPMMMTFPAGGWSWWRSPDVGWGGALVRGWGGPNALYRPAGGCTAVLEPAMELVLC